MAWINITLNLPGKVIAALSAMAEYQGRSAQSLAAIVEKINEPTPPSEPPDGYVLESDVQDKIATLAARLRTQHADAAAFVEQYATEQFPGGSPSPSSP